MSINVIRRCSYIYQIDEVVYLDQKGYPIPGIAFWVLDGQFLMCALCLSELAFHHIFVILIGVT